MIGENDDPPRSNCTRNAGGDSQVIDLVKVAPHRAIAITQLGHDILVASACGHFFILGNFVAVEELDSQFWAESYEKYEIAEAKRRRASSGGKGRIGSGNLPEPKSDSREKIGAAVGLSGKTYERARIVVKAAKAESYEKYEIAEAKRRMRSGVKQPSGKLPEGAGDVSCQLSVGTGCSDN